MTKHPRIFERAWSPHWDMFRVALKKQKTKRLREAGHLANETKLQSARGAGTRLSLKSKQNRNRASCGFVLFLINIKGMGG
jgi:hypothetical protein